MAAVALVNTVEASGGVVCGIQTAIKIAGLNH